MLIPINEGFNKVIFFPSSIKYFAIIILLDLISGFKFSSLFLLSSLSELIGTFFFLSFFIINTIIKITVRIIAKAIEAIIIILQALEIFFLAIPDFS